MWKTFCIVAGPPPRLYQICGSFYTVADSCQCVVSRRWRWIWGFDFFRRYQRMSAYRVKSTCKMIACGDLVDDGDLPSVALALARGLVLNRGENGQRRWRHLFGADVLLCVRLPSCMGKRADVLLVVWNYAPDF